MDTASLQVFSASFTHVGIHGGRFPRENEHMRSIFTMTSGTFIRTVFFGTEVLGDSDHCHILGMLPIGTYMCSSRQLSAFYHLVKFLSFENFFSIGV